MLHNLLFFVIKMCLHPKIPVNLLDRPIEHTSCSTFYNNCDYLSVDNRINIEPDDIVVLQLNI